MAQKSEQSPALNPLHQVLNFAAFHDSLVNNDSLYSAHIYDSILSDESDTTQSMDYFFVSMRHLSQERGDAADTYTYSFQIFRRFARKVGFDKFIFYLMMRRPLLLLNMLREKSGSQEEAHGGTPANRLVLTWARPGKQDRARTSLSS